jgi:hypothetical protein
VNTLHKGDDDDDDDDDEDNISSAGTEMFLFFRHIQTSSA